MPCRSRMHIICLQVRTEILIRCTQNSRMGHADHRDIHIPVILTFMKTLCYNLEGSFSTYHVAWWVWRRISWCMPPPKTPIPPAPRSSSLAKGLVACAGDPGHRRWCICSSLDYHFQETPISIFYWVSWNHSVLNRPYSVEKDTTNYATIFKKLMTTVLLLGVLQIAYCLIICQSTKAF